MIINYKGNTSKYHKWKVDTELAARIRRKIHKQLKIKLIFTRVFFSLFFRASL